MLFLLPVILCLVFNEDLYLQFLIPSIISFILGIILDKKFEKGDLNLGSAMILSAITFIFVSLIGSIPFLFYLSPIDALFESVSGFTTTGLTMINPEGLPYSLLFWRSFTQWIGGVGILIIFILLISSPGISAYYIYESEGMMQRIRANIYNTVKRIFVIYGFYTAIGIILLFIVGMPLFDSVVHTFSSVSTGGFSIKNNSIAFYNNIFVEIVIIFLMIVGATSFFMHDKILKGGIKDYLKNKEVQMFWFISILFSILLSIFLISSEPIKNGIFHSFSALTTTGFYTVSNFSEVSKFLLIILMIIGGCVGSTAGGIKIIRVGIISNAMSWLNKKISYPVSAVIPFKFDKKTIKEYEVTILSLFALIYIVILIISTLVINLSGYSFIDSMFISASAEGTVGLSTIDVYSMPIICKLVLIIDMLLGRLEIIPFMVLFYSIFSRIRKR